MSLFNILFISFSIKSGITFNNILTRVFFTIISLKILLISYIPKFKIKRLVRNPSIFLFFLILLLVIIVGSIFSISF